MPLPNFQSPNSTSMTTLQMTQELDAKTRMLTLLLDKAGKLNKTDGADTQKEINDIVQALQALQAQLNMVRSAEEKLYKAEETMTKFIQAQ